MTFDGLEGAISAYVAVIRGAGHEPNFDSAVIDITTRHQIDEDAAAKAITAISKSCRRLYAFVKHGSPRHRLNNREKKECKPDVTRPGPNSIRFDFRRTLRNAWGVAAEWAAPTEQISLWAKLHELFDDKTTRLDEKRTQQILKTIVITAGLAIATVNLAPIFAHYALESQKEGNRQQLALEMLSRVHVEGGSTAMAKADREKIAQDTEATVVRVANVLSELNRDDPVYRFVGLQIENFRPALFEVLAESGGGLINGVEFTTMGAKATAKQLKSNSRKIIPPWSTTTSIAS